MFPEQEPMVLQDLFEQLYGRKDLVIEYILNGKISERVMEQLNKQEQQRQRRERQRERSAFDDEDDGVGNTRNRRQRQEVQENEEEYGDEVEE